MNSARMAHYTLDSRRNTDMLSGAEFFRNFVDAFVAAVDTPETIPWLYYQKRRIGKAQDLTDSDWTPMMITFLDLLAWRLEFIQLHEKPASGGVGGRRDCVWVERDSPRRCVAIEAENNARSALNSEVPALLTDDAPLKVLVTYPYPRPGETSEEWRERFLPTLYQTITSDSIVHDPKRPKISSPFRPAGDSEFLLIFGECGVEDNPRKWRGYSLSKQGGKWESDWAIFLP